MVTFRALGAMAVLDGDAEVAIGGPRQRRLLAMLLIHRNSVVATDRLADVVFAGEPTDAAATTIRSYIARLRRVVERGDGPPRVATQAPGYRLEAPDDLVDTARFEQLVDHARTVLLADPSSAAALVRAALGMWAGSAYAEFADEAWAYGEAHRLEELRLTALELLFEAELAAGRDGDLVGEIEPIAREHRLRGSLQAHLMTSLYRAGRQADALRVFQEHRRALVEELGLEPSGALQTLERRILEQDPDLLDVRPTERSVRAYRLGERLGVGPDSVLYAARLPGIERPLVVRAYRPEVADEPAFVRDFDADARRVAALRHPAIVPIHDHWREPGAAYLVLGRLPGGSLADRLRHGPLDAAEMEALIRRIGGALLEAGDAGVVHGRVGASNVLYDSAGQPHLTDFEVGRPALRSGLDEDRRAFCTLVALCSPDLLGPAPDPASDAPLSEAVDALLDALGRRQAEPAASRAANPYKGLFAFDEADADDFFGRDTIVDDVLGRLRRDDALGRLVLVVGGSGSGKSSVVRAGVVPRVRRGELAGSGDWYVTVMLPGATPFESLAESLERVTTGSRSIDASGLRHAPGELDRALRAIVPAGAQLLLVVDQFEELFTLSPPADQQRFLAALVHAIEADGSRLRLVGTLRADYYGHPLAVTGFGGLVQDATVTVPAMTPAEVEAAVVGPAMRVGRAVERPLVADLVANVSERPAALPALQFALYQLAATTVGPLTLQSYRELGGITGAIATRAEALYRELDDADRRALRRMFERLTVVAPDTEPTRRAAERTELTGDPPDPQLGALVDRWIAARLLTADRHPRSRLPTVEVAHEALLREWPRLREWLDADRDDLIVLANLRHATATWLELDRDDGGLYRGARLDVALAVTASRRDELPPAEREYLAASCSARDAEAERATAAAAAQARANRRLRVQLAVIAVALVAALAGGVVAVDQRNDAERERRIATARELASASTGNLTEDPDLSTLLALAAVDATAAHGDEPIAEAVQALHAAVSSHRLLLDVPGIGGALDWSPAGDLFVTEGPEESGVIDIRDASTGDTVHAFDGHDPDVNDVKFSRDGSLLATTGDDGALRIWDPRNGSALDAFVEDAAVSVWAPSFSPDGTRAAAAWFEPDGPVIRLFDLATGAAVWERPGPAALAISFSPDGALLALANNGDGLVDIVDASTGDVSFAIPTGQLWVKDVAFSPDGRWLATAGGDATVRLWDASSGDPVTTITAHEGFVNSIDWSGDSRLLATAAADGTARVIAIDDGTWREVGSVSALSLNGGVADVAFAPDGTTIMTGDFTIESVKIWDVSPTAGGEVFNVMGSPSGPSPLVWTANDRIVAASPGGNLSVWSGEDGRLLDTFGPLVPTGSEITKFSVSPDGTLVATTDDELPIGVWDLRTGAEVGRIDSPQGGFVMQLAWHPDGDRIAVALGREESGVVLVSDLRGARVQTFSAEPEVYMRDVQFDPAGDRLYTAMLHIRDAPDHQGTRAWDLASGDVVATFDAPAGALAVDPAGRFLATSRTLDGVGDVWDVRTGEHAGSLVAPAGLNDLAFSPDGARIATSSQDGTVRVWDAATGAQQVVLPHDQQVHAAVFSPDGTRVVSQTYDGVIRVWTLDLDELVAVALRRVTRALTDEECRQYLHVERCPTR